jgi:uncharacterized coiled-coil protein SlyX
VQIFSPAQVISAMSTNSSNLAHASSDTAENCEKGENVCSDSSFCDSAPRKGLSEERNDLRSHSILFTASIGFVRQDSGHFHSVLTPEGLEASGQKANLNMDTGEISDDVEKSDLSKIFEMSANLRQVENNSRNLESAIQRHKGMLAQVQGELSHFEQDLDCKELSILAYEEEMRKIKSSIDEADSKRPLVKRKERTAVEREGDIERCDLVNVMAKTNEENDVFGNISGLSTAEDELEMKYSGCSCSIKEQREEVDRITLRINQSITCLGSNDQVIKLQEASIQMLRSRLDEKDVLLKRTQEKLLQDAEIKDHRFLELENRFQEREETIENLTNLVADRNMKIAALKMKVKELEDEIMEKCRELRQIQGALSCSHPESAARIDRAFKTAPEEHECLRTMPSGAPPSPCGPACSPGSPPTGPPSASQPRADSDSRPSGRGPGFASAGGFSMDLVPRPLFSVPSHRAPETPPAGCRPADESACAGRVHPGAPGISPVSLAPAQCRSPSGLPEGPGGGLPRPLAGVAHAGLDSGPLGSSPAARAAPPPGPPHAWWPHGAAAPPPPLSPDRALRPATRPLAAPAPAWGGWLPSPAPRAPAECAEPWTRRGPPDRDQPSPHASPTASPAGPGSQARGRCVVVPVGGLGRAGLGAGAAGEPL